MENELEIKNESIIEIEKDKGLRINKEDHMPFYNIFKASVGESALITTTMRNEIIVKWMEIKPQIENKNTFQQFLSRMERKYFELQPNWTKEQLRTKMTLEHEAYKESIHETENSKDLAQVVRKAKAIRELNEASAKINNLAETPPIQSIFINTNAPSLVGSMNEGYEIVPNNETSQLEKLDD